MVSGAKWSLEINGHKRLLVSRAGLSLELLVFRPTVVRTGLPKLTEFCSLCVMPFCLAVVCTGLPLYPIVACTGLPKGSRADAAYGPGSRSFEMARGT